MLEKILVLLFLGLMTFVPAAIIAADIIVGGVASWAIPHAALLFSVFLFTGGGLLYAAIK